jgi:hypothetical protein
VTCTINDLCERVNAVEGGARAAGMAEVCGDRRGIETGAWHAAG